MFSLLGEVEQLLHRHPLQLGDVDVALLDFFVLQIGLGEKLGVLLFLVVGCGGSSIDLAGRVA